MDVKKRIGYKELFARQLHATRMSYHVRKLSVFLLYVLQGVPLTPNFFTAGSIVLAVAAVAALAILGSKALFILLSMAVYVFDQMDGMWARLKGMENAWGRFFDPFADSVKFFIMDVGFILFHFDRLAAFFGDPKLLTFFFSAHFAFREFYSVAAVQTSAPDASPKALPIGLTGSTARYFVFFPAIALFGSLVIPYFLASFSMHVLRTLQFVKIRYRQEFSRKA